MGVSIFNWRAHSNALRAVGIPSATILMDFVICNEGFASPKTFADCVVTAALTITSYNQIARAA